MFGITRRHGGSCMYFGGDRLSLCRQYSQGLSEQNRRQGWRSTKSLRTTFLSRSRVTNPIDRGKHLATSIFCTIWFRICSQGRTSLWCEPMRHVVRLGGVGFGMLATSATLRPVSKTICRLHPELQCNPSSGYSHVDVPSADSLGRPYRVFTKSG